MTTLSSTCGRLMMLGSRTEIRMNSDDAEVGGAGIRILTHGSTRGLSGAFDVIAWTGRSTIGMRESIG